MLPPKTGQLICTENQQRKKIPVDGELDPWFSVCFLFLEWYQCAIVPFCFSNKMKQKRHQIMASEEEYGVNGSI